MGLLAIDLIGSAFDYDLVATIQNILLVGCIGLLGTIIMLRGLLFGRVCAWVVSNDGKSAEIHHVSGCKVQIIRPAVQSVEKFKTILPIGRVFKTRSIRAGKVQKKEPILEWISRIGVRGFVRLISVKIWNFCIDRLIDTLKGFLWVTDVLGI